MAVQISLVKADKCDHKKGGGLTGRLRGSQTETGLSLDPDRSRFFIRKEQAKGGGGMDPDRPV